MEFPLKKLKVITIQEHNWSRQFKTVLACVTDVNKDGEISDRYSNLFSFSFLPFIHR